MKSFPEANPKDEFYADWDEESQLWHVFGTHSGHSYASFFDEKNAVDYANERGIKKTKVTLELPKEAAERLLKQYKENPEAVKAEFKKHGFDVLNILDHLK